MKKLFNWQVVLGIILISLSALVYFVHYLIFRDLHHIFIYLIGDIGFVFIEVFMVTVVIHQLLVRREKQVLLNKMNMVIGAFFSEVGLDLLKILAHFLTDVPEFEKELLIANDWTTKRFDAARLKFRKTELKVDSRKGDLSILRDHLLMKRQFLLNLLQNQNLMEHESFTNCLWAVFHMTEELSLRKHLTGLPDADYKHISGDIKRAYNILICEWISYMKHLKTDYPYLFSLAVRTNPFNKDAAVVVR